MRNNIITGLDIGSTKIRIVTGQKDSSGKLKILGLTEQPSQGISKGSIIAIEEAVSSISQALEEVERMAGLSIEHALVGISGSHIISQVSRGVIAIAKADGEIKEDDIERVIEAAQAVATPPNYEILHVIPREFTVDSQGGIRDPLGMTGIRLEVEAIIIQGLSSQIKNLTKAVERTGVKIDDLVLSILASAESILSPRQKELGVALLNIGGTTSSLIVFEENNILHTTQIPIGSSHITADIAIGLRTSLDIAEQIKLEYGESLSERVNKRDEIDLAQVSENLESQDEGHISRFHIAEIIQARCEEIFSLANKELGRIERSGKLPAGVILTGGGAKLPGLVELAKKEFRLPASLGYPHDIYMGVDRVLDPAFSTALGLCLWGKELNQSFPASSLFSHLPGIEEVTTKVKKWFKLLLP